MSSASHSGFRLLARPEPHHPRRRGRGGFTLVEVLVVVGILVLLASILIPVVSRARAQAVRTACANQLHVLGQAVAAFGGEHNGNLPTAGSDVPDPTTGDVYPKSTDWILWGGSANPNGIDTTNKTDYMNECGLAKYLGTTTADQSSQPNDKLRNAYRCPSVTEEQRANDAYKYDYVFNAQLSGLPTDRVDRAGQKAMIVEAGHQGNGTSDYKSVAVDSAYRYWSPTSNTVALRHGGNGANCLYADGHVEVLDPKYNADFTVWDAYYTPAASASTPAQQVQKQNNPTTGGHYNAAQ